MSRFRTNVRRDGDCEAIPRCPRCLRCLRGTPRSDESGIVLIPTLATVFIIVAVGSSVLLNGFATSKSLRVHERTFKAREIAEAGVGFIAQELEQERDIDGDGTIGRVTGSFGDGTYEAVSIDEGNGDFVVRSRGVVGGVARAIEVVLTASDDRRIYPNGFVGRHGVDVGPNVKIDSYDSNWLYLLQRTSFDHKGFYADDDAIVMSNGSIDVSSSAVIRGDAHPGPGEHVTLDLGAYLTGSTAALEDPAAFPDPPESDFQWAFENNHNGNWSVEIGAVTYDPAEKKLNIGDNTRLLLGPGVYYFSELKLTGSGALVILGKTKIYLTGDAELSGLSVLNATGRPGNLELIAHPYEIDGVAPPAEPQIQLAGGLTMTMAMAIYAPAYSVHAECGGGFYGAIVAGDLSMESMFLHYDESLAIEGTPAIDDKPTTMTRRSWRDTTSVSY